MDNLPVVNRTATKKTLILSDNEGLAQTIAALLERQPELEVQSFIADDQSGRCLCGDERSFDLVVAAMSSPANEPFLALARAGLCGLIGCVPLIVLSAHPYRTQAGEQIYQLGFPFDINRFLNQVTRILEGKKP